MAEQTPSGETEAGGEKLTHARGPMGIELLPHPSILREVRLLAGDGDMRVPKLASLVIQDPVLTIELLKVANATYFSGDRPAIASVANAIVRLGSGAIVETLDQLAARVPPSAPGVAVQFELLRALSREVSAVSNIVATVASRDLSELAETAGLLSYVGHLVACAYFGERYTDACANRQITSLAYKLQQDFEFDVRTAQITYLRMRGIPNSILIALDRDIQCKSPSQAALRFTVQGAMELVEAAHSGKWEKYDPSHPLPGKSNLRLLKLTDHQYATIYEATSEALKGAIDGPSAAAPSAAPAPAPQATSTETNVQAVIEKEADYVTRSTAELEEDSNTLSDGGKQIVSVIQQLCANCRSTQDLLTTVMNLLITDGPYARAALILLTKERQSAIIHTAIGQGIQNGETLIVEDPLSPLALCLTKINSFNCQGLEDTMSPLGITSYAISPLKMKQGTPVVLYADCGYDRPLPLEARKIFRLVMGLLNRILPALPGGLPKRPNKPSPSAPA